MCKHKNFILMIILFLIVNALVFGRSIDKEFHKTFDVQSGDIIFLNHGDGDVFISSWDKNVIDVEVYFSADIFSLGNGDYDFDVKFEQQDNEVEVSEYFSNRRHTGIRSISIHRYEYIIRVPEYIVLNLIGDDGDVKIQDMNANINVNLSDGDMEMINITANLIKLRLEDGSLELKNIKSELDINTDDGDVTIFEYTGKTCRVDIEDGRLEIDRASGNFDVTSDDGDMELRRLIADNLQASSADGDIYIDLVRSNKPDMHISTDDAKVIIDLNADISTKVEIETDDGRINTNFSNPGYERKKENYYYSELNGGEGSIKIRTNDGNVTLREVK